MVSNLFSFRLFFDDDDQSNVFKQQKCCQAGESKFHICPESQNKDGTADQDAQNGEKGVALFEFFILF